MQNGNQLSQVAKLARRIRASTREYAAVFSQRLWDALRDNLRIAGWTRPDRSTYLGYREAAQRSAVARM